MFVLVEAFRSAWESIIANAFRSVLTTLGIVIGVASVVAVIALVEGLNQSITAQFEGLGTNSLSVSSYTPLEDRLRGKFSRITGDELDLIAQRIDGVTSITPLLIAQNGFAQIRYGAQTTFTQVRGTTHTYQDVYNSYSEVGRFLSPSDDAKRRRVCVIGEKVIDSLQLPGNPIGEYIAVSGEWLKVIGVMEARGELLGMDQDDYILVPFSTMRSLNGAQARPDIVIQLAVANVGDMAAIKQRIATLLRQSRKLRPDEADDFRIQTPEQIAETFDQIINTVTIVVGGIVGISLLVGGIGIMNIMLVSVTERTREIGICKALGAQRHHILLQFLIEALALSVLGGAVGLLLGYGMGVLIATLVPNFPPVSVPLWAIGLALGFSGFVGVIFGILPASKAADLDPIEALRYE